MAAKTFLRLIAGVWSQVAGTQVSTGVANAGDIPALDDTGKLDPSLMPTGVGADTVVLPATEALSAGNYVNIYDAAGTPSVRKADATTAGKPADGYVTANVANGANATVYKEGTNSSLTGMTGGSDLYLSTTPGLAAHVAPSAAGNIVQRLGKATSATAGDFERGQPVTLVAV